MRALDLFSGAGGAAVGLHRAGFDVVGVDTKPQPHYPFEHHEGDAIEWLTRNGAEGFDLIWASPPCQRFSMYSRNMGTWENHPDLIDPVRTLLERSGVSYIIENVPGAPLRNPVTLCGSMFDLDVRRHRLFETSFEIFPHPQCRHWIWQDRKYPGATNRPNGRYTCEVGVRRIPVQVQVQAMDPPMAPVPVYGNGTPQWHRKKYGRNVTAEEQRRAMSIDWMTREELSQAIPPAYSEWLGRLAMEYIERSAA